jgi:phenylpropionate dioxygenase-like ring-hydroxylating dioxygenase large terminal subunit
MTNVQNVTTTHRGDKQKKTVPGLFEPGRVSLRDTWIPVAHVPQIRRRPRGHELHGRQVYIWRDHGGRIRAAEDRDLSRSAALATEATGGRGEFPVVERYGYVWIWYGDPDHLSEDLIPDCPYLPRSGAGRPFHMWGTLTFHSTYELVCENLLDLTHVDFLHSKLIGDELCEEDQISVESTSETVTMIREANGRRTPPAQRWFARSDRQDMRAVTHVHLRSGVVVLHGNFSPGLSVRLFHPLIPASSERTTLKYSFNPKGANALARNAFPLVSPIIARQDDAMLRPQNGRYLESSDRPDVSSQFDAAGLQYRIRMQQLVARQQAGDFSYQGDADPGQDIAELLQVERVPG